MKNQVLQLTLGALFSLTPAFAQTDEGTDDARNPAAGPQALELIEPVDDGTDHHGDDSDRRRGAEPLETAERGA